MACDICSGLLCNNMMMMIIIIMIIIIALKGATSELLQSPHCTANYFQHVHSSGPGASFANHIHHIEHLSRASCSVAISTKGQV